MSNLVIYHGGKTPCTDGHTAAWSARKFLDKDTDFLGAAFGDSPPDVVGKDVYILDFSYPRAVLEKMHSEAASLVVLDHHKSAAEDLQGLDYCIFDMQRSGAQMAWDHFSGEKARPWMVDYVADRDLWRFALPNSREINEALYSYDLDFEVWDEIETRYKKEFLAEGKALWRLTRKQIQEACKLAYKKLYKDEPILVTACSTNISDIGSSLRDDFGVRMSAVWLIQADGSYKVSLRSTKDYDCSLVAKEYGGGGHLQASGFVCKELPEWLTPTST